jgi:hypothetical protein
LIKSGNIFIYEKRSSGINRWTDGVSWSSSRSSGDFLVYRELEKSQVKTKRSSIQYRKKPPGIHNQSSNLVSKTKRTLDRSFTGSSGFQEGGLIKKSMTVTVRGVSHHLVSYFTVHDISKFNTPSNDPRFQHIHPRAELTT